MRYLYGDGSEFPLRENFLDTLDAAADMCAGLMAVDADIVGAGHATAAANGAAASEIGRLTELAKSLAALVSTHAPAQDQGASAGAARCIARYAHQMIQRARHDIARERARSVDDAAPAHIRDRVTEVLSRFLVRHRLPNTEWQVRWNGGMDGSPAHAWVRSRTPYGIAAEYDVAIPDREPWAGPISVKHVVDDVVVKVVRPTLWRIGERLRDVHLGKYYITEAELTLGRTALTLRKSRTEPSAGFAVIETRGERDSLVLLPLDKIGNVDGDPLVPSLEAAVALRRLVDELRRRASRLIRCRQRVVTASIDSLPDGALSRPLALAEAILEALAPYVRELRERSVQANDLTLVHESETGQRTRFSLRADVMRAKVAQLPEEYRTTFASYGYGLRAGDDDDAVTQRLTRIDFERLRARLFGNSAVAA